MTHRKPKPARAPDVEEHGDGAPPEAVRERANAAYYAELAFDALGDPEHAPRGWWNLKLWNGP